MASQHHHNPNTPVSPPPDVAVVVAGGGTTAGPLGGLMPPGALVIAADSGADALHAANIVPALAVGDFDSASPTAMTWLADHNVPLDTHPTDKDATDLELALGVAAQSGAQRLVVIGSGGGRLDHLLAGVASLGAPHLDNMWVSAHFGDTDVMVAKPATPVTLTGRTGELTTLLAYGEPATGVTTTGFRFALHGDTLAAWTSRGVSNVIDHSPATVTVTTGVVMVLLPGAPGTPRHTEPQPNPNPNHTQPNHTQPSQEMT